MKNLLSETQLVWVSVVRLNIYRHCDLSVSSHMYYVVYDIQFHMEVGASIGGLLPFLSGCECPLQMANQKFFSLCVDWVSSKKKRKCHE